jgi:hypothetical protein
LAADVLVVGEIYEVMHIDERDGYYALSGLGRFTMTRFKLVSAAEAGHHSNCRRDCFTLRIRSANRAIGVSHIEHQRRSPARRQALGKKYLRFVIFINAWRRLIS